MKINIKYKPHQGQIEVLEEIKKNKSANFFTISAARGFGKTAFILGDFVIPYCLANPNAQVMWVAPFSAVARTPVDDFFSPFVPKFINNNEFRVWEYFYQKNEIQFYNGSKIYFKTADSPDSIVSKGYNLIVVDEAAIVPGKVFQQQILACARRGSPMVILISTPRGRNWFYEYFQRGLDSEKSNYFSIKKPWYSRPDYPKFLQETMKDLPEHVVRQEYLAEFVDDGGLVFRGIDKVLYGDNVYLEGKNQHWELPEPPKDTTSYVVGVDFAKEVDYNVITVMDCMSKRIVEYHRENKKDYKTILSKIERISNKYFGAEVIYDATGVGAGLSDFLSKKLNVIPFKFTNDSKNELIHKLILSIENQQILLPNLNTIKLELESFSYAVSRTGKITYSAPSGMHDDVVISIALCNLYAQEHYQSGEIEAIDIAIEANQSPNSFYDWMEQDDD